MNISYPQCSQAGVTFVISTNEELQENPRFLAEDFPVSMYTQNYNHAALDHTPFHWHEELQITWVYEGSLAYCINGDTFSLDSSKILFIKNRQLHSARTDRQDAKTLCFNFRPEIFPSFLQKNCAEPFLKKDTFSYALTPLKPYNIELLNQLLLWENNPDGFSEYFTILSFLSQTFKDVLNDGSGNAPGDAEEIRCFRMLLSYVHQHYAEPLTIKKMSQHSLLDKNRLTALFKKYTNLSPIKYLNEYRLYKAKNLIVGTDKSISEISADTGYCHVSYFIEQFRTAYGLPPLKYRQKYQT